MSKWLKGLAVAWWIAAPVLVTGVIAQIVSGLPFTLTNGTVADATQVMANFNQIVNNANANAAKNGVNNDITALTALVTPLTPTQGGTSVFIATGTGGGTANAQTIAATLPSTFALTTNYAVQFVPGFTNTGATTLAVNATAAKNVFKASASGSIALTGGEIVAGQSVEVSYDGAQYVITSSTPFFEPVNSQTGATYTFLNSDNSKLVTASNAAAQAYTLPQAGTASAFPVGWYVDLYNKSTASAGVVTVTPTTSTVDGAATLVLAPGGSARIISDGTNYQVAIKTTVKAPTVQKFTSGGPLTYTPTAGMIRIKGRIVGGGGGAGAVTTNNGVAGSTTTFGGWTAAGGAAGATSGGFAGGTGGGGGSDGTGLLVIRIGGGDGSGGGVSGTAGVQSSGGIGGSNPFGGAGRGGVTAGAVGGNGHTNTGAGGGGSNNGSATNSSGGGGAGEYVEFWMTAAQVGASLSYTVGAGGAGGAAGVVKGGDGAAGVILIEEFYQKFMRQVCDAPANDNYAGYDFERCKAS